MKAAAKDGSEGVEQYPADMAKGELPRDWHEILDQLHEALIARMEQDALTQKAVEDATGIPNPNLSRFLKKQRGFSWKAAASLADFLGYTLALNPKSKHRRK